MLDVILEIRGNALQAADRHRRFLDPDAAARGLARTVAGAAEDSREHIRFPVDHVGVAITAFGDQADIFRHGRMRGAGPLAIDNLVKVIGCRNISRFHSYLVRVDVTVTRPLMFPANAHKRRSCCYSSYIMSLMNRRHSI